jgi:hypothetical protein
MKWLDLPILLWGAATAAGLLAPQSSLESASGFPDWVPAAVHFVLFFVMVILVGRRLYAIGSSWPLLGATVAAFAYGAALELGPLAVPGRSFEPEDLLMNGLGCLAGAGVASLWRSIGRSQSSM